MMKNSRNSREGVHNKKGLLIVQEGRIEWMDAAKGYGILLVVFAHLGIGAIPTSYLNSFYMPLFFFCRDMYFPLNAKQNDSFIIKQNLFCYHILL